jgi:hypothetical protein
MQTLAAEFDATDHEPIVDLVDGRRIPVPLTGTRQRVAPCTNAPRRFKS